VLSASTGRFRGDAREQNIPVQMRTERLKAIEGAPTMLPEQLGRRRTGHAVVWRGSHAVEYAK
jgi:hypothetical protein